MPLGHALERRVPAVARIRGDVVDPDDARAGKGRLEQFGDPRHRELVEHRARRPGQRIEHVALALGLVGPVVEEGAELRPDQRHARIHRGLRHARAVALARDRGARLVDHFQRARLFLQRLARFPLARRHLEMLGPVGTGAEDAHHLARGIADRRHRQVDMDVDLLAAAARGLHVQAGAEHRLAGERPLEIGAHFLPHGRPAPAIGAAEDPRVLVAIGVENPVVVEKEIVGAPGDEGALRRSEHQVDRLPELARPVRDRTELRHREVRRPQPFPCLSAVAGPGGIGFSHPCSPCAPAPAVVYTCCVRRGKTRRRMRGRAWRLIIGAISAEHAQGSAGFPERRGQSDPGGRSLRNLRRHRARHRHLPVLPNES